MLRVIPALVLTGILAGYVPDVSASTRHCQIALTYYAEYRDLGPLQVPLEDSLIDEFEICLDLAPGTIDALNVESGDEPRNLREEISLAATDWNALQQDAAVELSNVLLRRSENVENRHYLEAALEGRMSRYHTARLDLLLSEVMYNLSFDKGAESWVFRQEALQLCKAALDIFNDPEVDDGRWYSRALFWNYLLEGILSDSRRAHVKGGKGFDRDTALFEIVTGKALVGSSHAALLLGSDLQYRDGEIPEPATVGVVQSLLALGDKAADKKELADRCAAGVGLAEGASRDPAVCFRWAYELIQEVHAPWLERRVERYLFHRYVSKRSVSQEEFAQGLDYWQRVAREADDAESSRYGMSGDGPIIDPAMENARTRAYNDLARCAIFVPIGSEKRRIVAERLAVHSQLDGALLTQQWLEGRLLVKDRFIDNTRNSLLAVSWVIQSESAEQERLKRDYLRQAKEYLDTLPDPSTEDFQREYSRSTISYDSFDIAMILYARQHYFDILADLESNESKWKQKRDASRKGLEWLWKWSSYLPTVQWMDSIMP